MSTLPYENTSGMNMKKHLIISGIIIILIFVGFSGCSELNPSSDDSILVGDWTDIEGNNEVITFFSDGKWIGNGTMLGGFNGTYEIKDGKLVLYTIIEGVKCSKVCNYNLSDDNTKLTLTTTDNKSIVLTKLGS